MDPKIVQLLVEAFTAGSQRVNDSPRSSSSRQSSVDEHSVVSTASRTYVPRDRRLPEGYCYLAFFLPQFHDDLARKHGADIRLSVLLDEMRQYGVKCLSQDRIGLRCSGRIAGLFHASVDDSGKRPEEWLVWFSTSTKNPFANIGVMRVGRRSRNKRVGGVPSVAVMLPAVGGAQKASQKKERKMVTTVPRVRTVVSRPFVRDDPVGAATIVRARAPGASSSGDVMRFRKTEVIVPEVKAVPGVQAFQISPGYFPWLKNEARNWARYRFVTIVAEFITSQPSTANGRFTMAFDYSTTLMSDDGTYNGIAAGDLMSLERAVQCSVWSSRPRPLTTYDPRRRQVAWFYTGEKAGHLNEDVALLFAYSGSLAPDQIIGDIQLTYMIEFTQPTISRDLVPGVPGGRTPIGQYTDNELFAYLLSRWDKQVRPQDKANYRNNVFEIYRFNLDAGWDANGFLYVDEIQHVSQIQSLVAKHKGTSVVDDADSVSDGVFELEL